MLIPSDLEDIKDEIVYIILDQIEQSLEFQRTLPIYIGLAIAAAVIVFLLIFLHPRSPWVKKRAEKKAKKEREELEKKKKEERRQQLIKNKLRELNHTCKFCNAPGLKGPKCEYCQNINFSID